MIQKYSIIALSLFLFACNDSNTESNDKNSSTEEQSTDSEENPNGENVVNNHSYSNIDEINTTHLHLDFEVDFDQKRIKGVARHKMNNTGVQKAIFDVQGLSLIH